LYRGPGVEAYSVVKKVRRGERPVAAIGHDTKANQPRQPVSKLSFVAPRARNAIAWAIGPGTSQIRFRALKARNERDGILILTVSAPELPWAITFRAFGAVNSNFDTDAVAVGYRIFAAPAAMADTF